MPRRNSAVIRLKGGSIKHYFILIDGSNVFGWFMYIVLLDKKKLFKSFYLTHYLLLLLGEVTLFSLSSYIKLMPVFDILLSFDWYVFLNKNKFLYSLCKRKLALDLEKIAQC